MTVTLALVPPIPGQATLSPASVLAAHAHESGVDAEGISLLFSRCAEAGYGFPSRVEAAVMAELAALANGAA
jgi:hypothetical protein